MEHLEKRERSLVGRGVQRGGGAGHEHGHARCARRPSQCYEMQQWRERERNAMQTDM
jgi:hypothetical protein